METLELKNKLVAIINASSDEYFLNMVNTLHQKYQEKQTSDFFTELPLEIQEILLESRAQARKGKTRLHKEVMADFKAKYTTSS